jgi:GNAT superfamily N-acetyltransferase
VNVRPANEDDCAEIYRIQVAAVRGLPPDAEGKAGIEKWLATREPSVYAQAMRDEHMVVVEDGGALVGWGGFCAAKREITNVFVAPPHQRRGVGTAIIGALERAARAAGLDTVQLQATGTAIDFYRNVGYEPDPPVGAGASWALMKKAL